MSTRLSAAWLVMGRRNMQKVYITFYRKREERDEEGKKKSG